MELEESSIEFKPIIDQRPTMPEPPPVRLVAVDDVHVPAANGLESELDAFYLGLLRFERDPAAEPGLLVYRAENHRLCFDLLEPPIHRDTIRPTGIEIPALLDLQRILIDREIEFTLQRSLVPGLEALVLRDPAGNWVQITEIRGV